MAKFERIYVGSAPWDTISTSIENLPDSAAASKAANLDWEVKTFPLTAKLPTGELQHVDRKRISYREDTMYILGVVGEQFTPVNNLPAFKIVDDILALETGAKFDSAGSLDGGRRVYMTARIQHDIKIPNTNDVVRSYVMIQNAHDGSGELIARFVPMRLSNRTIMNAEVPGMRDFIGIRHTKFVESRIEEATRVMKSAKNYFENLQQIFEQLALIPMTRSKMEEIVNKVVPIKDDAIKATRTHSIREMIMQLYDSSTEGRDTGWAAYAAFCEYNDHYKGYKNTKKNTVAMYENRFLSILGGSTASIKNDALYKILESK